jgi:predicted dehydrogenase
MDRTLRVGIVGCGGMGAGHADHVVDNGHDVVAGADVDAGARERFGDEYDAATYADWEAMYDAADLDATIVTTPNAFHEPAAVAALDRDIHVEVEKPLADDLESAERVAAAARDSAAFAVLALNNRYTFPVETFAAYRDAGHFGDVNHVEANWVRRRSASPGPTGWFRDPELAGGGALIDIGVHVLDLALYMLDFPEVEEVSGVARSDFLSRDDGDPVDDSVSAFVRCAGDRTISLEAAWAVEQRPTQRMVARGTEAGAEFERKSDTLTLVELGEHGPEHETDICLQGEEATSGHYAEDEAFLAAVAAGEPPEHGTIEEALTVQRVIDAIYRSSRRGEACEPRSTDYR